MSALRAAACGLLVLLLSGCVTTPPSYDYTAYRQSRPKSILLLPPVNAQRWLALSCVLAPVVSLITAAALSRRSGS